jgi:hypothetical protein
MEFGELGGRFVEVFVAEFGDSPLFFRPLGTAILVKIDRYFADGFDLDVIEFSFLRKRVRL